MPQTTDQREALMQAQEALRRADTFITNGVALGFIRMPDADVPDSAHATPPAIRAAITVVGKALAQDADYESFGYALAMGVIQSDLYRQLDDRQRAECDELIARGQGRAVPLVAEAPPGMMLVPDWKGYALLGTGRYCLENSAAPPDPELGAELIIRPAKAVDVAGERKLYEERDTDGGSIQPEDMAIRIGFLTAEALDALESQLRHLRRENFPESVAAPPVSVAPMPEEWLKEAIDLAHEWAIQGYLKGLGRSCKIDEARAALLSHLRTAPRPTLSDEQIKAAAVAWHDNDTLGDETCEHRFLEIIAFAAGVRWVASVAPQPEQPNTEQPHLADNGRKPVQGLDAAAGVAPAHWTPGMVDRMNSLAEELKFDTVGVSLIEDQTK